MTKQVLKTLIKISNQKAILPFYHMVSDSESKFTKHLYLPRKVSVFKNDLDILLKYYQPISLQKLIEYSKTNKQINNPFFHLTFDDGLANFYNVVAPILEEKKIPATVFINTNFVDNKALFYRYKASLLIQVYEDSSLEIQQEFHDFFKTNKNIKERLLKINFNNKKLLEDLAFKVDLSFEEFLRVEKPYLSKYQIEDLIKRGFTIGAHSKNHPLYFDIDLQEQIKQTQESLDWLKRNFNIGYKAFSFPFTDLGVSKDFFSLMKPNLDISFGTSGIKKDRITTNFHRISFELENENIEIFLRALYLKYLFKIPLRKHIMPRF